jgi:hypothetical protein
MEQKQPRLRTRTPTHRLWLVEDGEDQNTWTELAALWPTRNGGGFTGRMKASNVFPAGARLVIRPVKTSNPVGEA